MLKRLAVLSLLLLTNVSSGQTVDGTIVGDPYGPAVSVQTVETQFGDNQSELNAAYATVAGGKLYLALTGNLEGNFNKLNIFVDSKAGGQNVINGALNPQNDNWAVKHNGMTFDSGFEPDYLFILRNGNANGDRFDLDYAVVGGGANDFDNYTAVFGPSRTGAATTAAGSNLGFSFDVGFDNSNAAGILGGTNAADPVAAQAVRTGVELGIPLSALGNPQPGQRVCFSAMVNGSNHDFLSNQVLGGLPAPQGNLGGDGLGNFTGNLAGINFNNFSVSEQFFCVVIPEPSGMAVCLLGVLGLALRRRRR